MSAAPASDAAPGPWSPLRRPVFRALWIAGLASNIGTWMQNVGAAWLMTSLEPTPFWVSMVQAASSLPFFFLAIPAGALADVVDRRRLLLLALAWLAATTAVLAALAFAGRVTPTGLLALTFAIGIGGACAAPAFLAIIPELVPRDEIPAAMSLNGISMNLARAAGPALGGLVVAGVGVAATFATNAVSYGGVFTVIARWRRASNETRLPPEELFGAMRGGLRYVRHSRPLQVVLARVALFVVPGSAIWALLPLYAREQLALGPIGYGLLLGFFGAGAVLGGLVLQGSRARFGAQRITTVSALAYALGLVLLGAVPTLPVAAVALLVAGAGWLALLTTLSAAAQMTLPGWVRARGLSVYLLVLFGGLALGSSLWGAGAESVGVPHTFELAGAAVAASRLFVWRLRLPEGPAPDLSSAPRWPDPQLAASFETEHRPVLVTVEYEIDPADTEAFAHHMFALGRIRLRDGALRWGLWADAAEPGRYLESFVVESWLEHLRQHERITAADRDVQALAHGFHRGPEPPRVTHFLRERIPEKS
ncbi:MFS transporter [Myxococcota bacterium]|nr:MFS transporter [Myxococcota bacterium]